jgi:hypothetical protein
MNAYQKVTDKARSYATDTLIASLIVLDREGLDESERIVRGSICGIIEERHPEVIPFMDAWVNDEWCPGVSYVQALVTALAAVVSVN